MAKKKESTLINMTLTLFLITLASGVALGYINQITEGPKAEMRKKRKLEAISAVLGQFDNDPAEEMYIPDSTELMLEVYPGSLNGNSTGLAISGYSEKGYSGLIRLMIGIDNSGVISDIVVLEQKETPGLGTKMKEERFLRQYRGKDPSTFDIKVKQDGGEIDALTGATISTRAFSEAVQKAVEVFESEKSKSKNGDQ
jgi:electron transport complex protein RnfG